MRNYRPTPGIKRMPHNDEENRVFYKPPAGKEQVDHSTQLWATLANFLIPVPNASPPLGVPTGGDPASTPGPLETPTGGAKRKLWPVDGPKGPSGPSITAPSIR